MTKRRSKKSQAAKKAKPKETKVEFLASLAGVLATGLFIMTFMVQGFAIPSGSMENTLLVGDHVFVNRIQYAPPTSWGEVTDSLRPDSPWRYRCIPFAAHSRAPRCEEGHWCARRQDSFAERRCVPKWSEAR